MKKNTFILFTALLLILFTSCNIDSNEGLFEMAGNAKREEEHTIIDILGKEGNELYVSTYDGIGAYDLSTNTLKDSFRGAGKEAREAIYADANSYAYYDENEGKYLSVDNDGSKTELTSLEGFKYLGMYSQNGENYTYLFSKDGKFYVYSSSSLSSASSIEPRMLEKENIDRTVITGFDTYYVRMDGKHYTYSFSKNEFSEKESVVTSSFKDCYVYADGKMVRGSESFALSSRNVSFAEYDSSLYIVPKGESNRLVYTIAEGKMSEKNISALSGLNIISILSVVNNKLTVLTAKNGIISINASEGIVE